jgi:hypothetical protein
MPETKPCPECGNPVYEFSETVKALTGDWGVCNKCWTTIKEVADEQRVLQGDRRLWWGVLERRRMA